MPCIGPGPAAYAYPAITGSDNHPILQRSPAYSLGLKDQRKGCSLGPGPAAYTTTNITRHGRATAPAYTMPKGRTPPPRENVPGPGAHNVNKNKVLPSAPAYSMPGKYSFRCGITPGPNSYHCPTNVFKPSVPAYTMARRYPRECPPNITPGPAAYNNFKDPILNRNPAYTMAHIYRGKRPSPSPGPNQYDLMNDNYASNERSPAYSFGIKHKNYDCA